MKASLQAQTTHHKALHDKTSMSTVRRHVHEANHGNSKFIECMDQQQQPWQNWLTCKNLPGTFYRKSRARLRHARSLHKCKWGHGWIENNHMFKTSLLKQLITSMDLTVATCLHGIKITTEQGQKNPKSPKSAISRRLLCMLVLVTILITKIHGKHPCKDGMA